MADYQRMIEFLRDVRQGAGSGGLQTVTEEIGHMAAEYAALCTAAALAALTSWAARAWSASAATAGEPVSSSRAERMRW